MTVIDSSAVVDYLVDQDEGGEIARILGEDPAPAAPDVVPFEVLSSVRRNAIRGALSDERAAAAIADLEDMYLDLCPSLALCTRAWELRHNFSAADALFVALAEQLDEPLATSDRGLARAARELGVDTIALPS